MEPNYMDEFSFDEESAKRIANVIWNYPMSLEDCADVLEQIAPLCEIYTTKGFIQKLRTDLRRNVLTYNKLSEYKKMPSAELAEHIFGVKLRWYQKAWLYLFDAYNSKRKYVILPYLFNVKGSSFNGNIHIRNQ